jgi:hypothetical protein
MEVDDADIDDLELVLAAPRSITGRVILPEGRWVPPALFVGLIPCERIVLL